MVDDQYDLFVIGTGSGGSEAAQMCSKTGWKVGIADKLPFGGTCALRGCNPKKTLALATEVVHRFDSMKGKGIKGSVQLDWGELMRFKQSLVEPVPEMNERNLSSAGIDMYHGECRFVDRNTLAVEGKNISARRILIATGSRPAHFPFPGAEHMMISDDFLNLEALPRRIVFMGGGYISFEFAFIAARAGAQVAVLEAMERPLRNFDHQLVDMLLGISREIGIDVRLGTPVKSVEKREGVFSVHAGSQRFETDLVVHGGGRVPNLDGLDLEAGGVEREKKGIAVNEFLQSVSNPAVYIAGDVNLYGIQLTPVAEMESRVVAGNMLDGNSFKPDYSVVPSIVFTTPSLASAGMREQEAQEKGLDFRVQFFDTSKKHITRRLGLKHSAFKVVSEKVTGRILGVHMLGHGVDEVINAFGLAIRTGMTIGQIKNMVWGFPTVMYDTVNRLSE
ncbi:MAG: dihydrolipoyl dehydrogenase family protein [Chitinispirillaceae bacterium]